MLDLVECKTDANRNIVYEKYYGGDEHWFDAKSNCTHTKYANGEEIWFDGNGNQIEKPNDI
jgi:hypothetical protein